MRFECVTIVLKNITRLRSLALLLLLHTRNNTDGSKLGIFFSMVLYGDTYIALWYIYIYIYILEYAKETYHSEGHSVVGKWSKVQFHSTARHSQTYI